MADDGGLELNLVSEPPAASQLNAVRKKKRGSGKAWDKKKRKSSATTSIQTPSGRNQQPQGQRQQVAGGGQRSEAEGVIKEKPSALAVKGSKGGGPGSRASRAPNSQGDTPAVAANLSTNHRQDRELGSMNKRNVAGHAEVEPPAQSSTNGAHVKAPTTKSGGKGKGGKHGMSNDNNNNNRSSSNDTNAEPSHERRRVLEMAERNTTTPHTPALALPASDGGQKKSNNGPSSSGRASKRKRPGATGGGGPESSFAPVVSGGVVDFTVKDMSTPNKKSKKNKQDGRRADTKDRKAMATAAAVAKATAAMETSGGKWWDDDDDDHVDVGAKARTAISARRYPGNDDFGGWKPGAAGGAGAEPSEERKEDLDGGLPSDVHPDSVRTKAVDMDGEAAKAMGILDAVLGQGGAGGHLEGSKRVKNGGKSKKKSREESLGAAEGNSGVCVANGKTAVDDSHVMDVEESTDENQGEKSAITRKSAKESGGGEGEPQGMDVTENSVTAEDDGRGVGGVEAADNDKKVASRKNRAREAKAAAVAAAAAGGSGGGSTVPLPEHHARPRELSRRAAVTPLPSTRSTHVMAAGPDATFAALNLPPKMVSHLEEPKGDLGGGGMGLVGPTVCQLAAVPVLAAGNNAVIRSETGSGKTLAYLLPMLCDLAAVEPKVEREKGTFAIVLAPTRELCSQILEVLTRVVRPFIWLVPGGLSGGERRKSEKARLRKGVSVLVCTPGRLLDHLKTTKCFRRESLRWLILDEADRLLDMGFEKQVKEIVELLDQSARAVRSGPAGGTRVQGGAVAPSIKVIKRQTVMVSATLDKGVSRMAATLLSRHMRVDVDANVVESVDESGKVKHVSGHRRAIKSKADLVHEANGAGPNGTKGSGNGTAGTAEEFSTPRQLVQYYMSVTQKLRLPALCSFLRARAREKVVVFMSTCDAVDFHHELFRRAGWPGDASTPSPDANEDGDPVLRENSSRQGKSNGGRSAEKTDKKKAAPTLDGAFFGPDCLVRRLHGNVPQNERQVTYKAFGAAKSGILICTDVAARGLDLPTVDWIVQYDPPSETADYVHRVGRTARKGERGHSLLFLMPQEAAYLGVLEARGLRPKPLSLEGVLCAADAGKRDARRADEQLAYELQQGLQLLVAENKMLLDRARAAFQSHVRAYAARAPESRAIFQVRSLHLGHVARSFALKDPPTAVKVGKQVVRRPGDVNRGDGKGGKVNGGGGGGGGAARGEKRRRDGAGGAGGSVHRLGLSKKTQLASRAEFL